MPWVKTPVTAGDSQSNNSPDPSHFLEIKDNVVICIENEESVRILQQINELLDKLAINRRRGISVGNSFQPQQKVPFQGATRMIAKALETQERSINCNISILTRFPCADEQAVTELSSLLKSDFNTDQQRVRQD